MDNSDQQHQPARLIGNRFEVLSDEASESERPTRRLVLIQNPANDHEWDPDTESIRGVSEVEVEDVEVESAAPDLPIPAQDRIHGVQRAFATLDVVDLIDVFSQRARVMHSVPWVIRGAFRAAVKVAMQEILAGAEPFWFKPFLFSRKPLFTRGPARLCLCVAPSFNLGSPLFVRTGLAQYGSSWMAADGDPFRLDPGDPRPSSQSGEVAGGEEGRCTRLSSSICASTGNHSRSLAAERSSARSRRPNHGARESGKV